MGTTSPALVVPQDKLTTTVNETTVAAMKTQTLPRLGVKNATNTPTPKSEESNSELNRVGHSVFYDCLDANNAGIIPTMIERTPGEGVELDEKQDLMKPERNDTDEESKF